MKRRSSSNPSDFTLAIEPGFDLNLFVLILKPLKSAGLALFLITVMGTGLDQWITLKMETELMSPHGASPLVWAFGGLSLLLNLAYPMIFLLVVLAGLAGEKPFAFLKKNFQQTLIEEMRAWGKAMLWSLALVIPGMIQFFRLVFVPFIVTLDTGYAAGQVDALEKSREISRGKIFQILALFVLFSLIIPAMLTSLDEYKLLWKTPATALVLCILEMFLNLCFILGLWKLYSSQPALQTVKENS